MEKTKEVRTREEGAACAATGKPTDWNKPRKTILDGLGVRLTPGIHAPAK